MFKPIRALDSEEICQGQYYDFETGAYISQDPIGLAEGKVTYYIDLKKYEKYI